MNDRITRHYNAFGTTAVKPAGEARQDKSGDKVENTAALSLLDRKGMKLHGKIVAGLHAKYSRQPDKLRAAQSATHVERAPKREKTSGGTSGTSTAGTKTS